MIQQESTSSSRFPPLSEGIVLNETYRHCPECGDVVYLRTVLMSAGDRELAYTERTSCRCDLEAEAERKQAERAEKEREIQRYFGRIDLLNYPNYRRMTFSSLKVINDNRKGIEAVRKYTAEFNLESPKNLVLGGRPGVGKTHLAVSCAQVLNQKGYSVLIAKTAELLNRLRQEYDKGSGISYLLNILTKNVEVLVIDDLGTAKMTPWALEQLYRIVDGRYDRLPTVVTTNYRDGNKLSQALSVPDMPYIGEAIVSRLFSGEPILVEGPDWRQI